MTEGQTAYEEVPYRVEDFDSLLSAAVKTGQVRAEHFEGSDFGPQPGDDQLLFVRFVKRYRVLSIRESGGKPKEPREWLVIERAWLDAAQNMHSSEILVDDSNLFYWRTRYPKHYDDYIHEKNAPVWESLGVDAIGITGKDKAVLEVNGINTVADLIAIPESMQKALEKAVPKLSDFIKRGQRYIELLKKG